MATSRVDGVKAPLHEGTPRSHPSKVSALENIEGSKKFRRAHNSGKEFCRGVPVNNKRRFAVYMFPSVWANFEDLRETR